MQYQQRFIWTLALFLANISCYADSWAFLNKYSTESTPLICSTEDQQWFMKSGPDAVEAPPITSETLYIEANSINGQQNQTHIAQGTVIGYRDTQTIVADWLIYDQKTSRATIGDNVVVTRQYDTITASWADYYLDLSKGTFRRATIFYSKGDISAGGESISIIDDKHANIKNAHFTTCDPKSPDWQIKANNISLDYENSSGTAKGATLYFESIPVFTSPYLTFPLGQRKSGWITPIFSTNQTAGAQIGLPYYWNIAPNYDMTITPMYWANRGFMFSDEFRYLNKSGGGSIYTEQMPYSTSTSTAPNLYRWYWNLMDKHTPIKNLDIGYNYNIVSDTNYFNDFGNFYSVTDNVNLEQKAFVNYSPSWGYTSIKVQNFQTLLTQGTSNTIPIYSSYPQINFNVNPQNLGLGFKVGLLSQYTYFYSPSQQSGQRLYAYPSITYPLQSSWGFITPKVGYNFTQYNLGDAPNLSNNGGSIQRSLGMASLDSGLYFDRPFSFNNKLFTQTFEPRLYYLYMPEINQGNIPLFDTANAGYNINQLFSENLFAGIDRINSANNITAGVTTRLINDTNGEEITTLGIGYRYFITPQNQSIYGNQQQFAQLFLPKPNLIAELTHNFSDELSTKANFQYDTGGGNITNYSFGIKFNPDDYKILNLRFYYQYQQPLLTYNWVPGQLFSPEKTENQYAIDISGQWPIYKKRLFAVGRTNYDFTQKQLLNIIGGLELSSSCNCWSISAVYQQFIFNLNQVQNSWFLQLNLKGLGAVGTDPNRDLQTKIPGYMPITQKPIY